jgi:hypothetical protein
VLLPPASGDGARLVGPASQVVVLFPQAAKSECLSRREGINPFTKEPTIFKAKPARKVIRARPVKAVKDAVA